MGLYSMPQLGQYKWIMDTVFFLYDSEEDARSGTEYGGTGFLVAIPSKRWPNDHYHVHGVTNWHVACRGSSVIRINRRDGGSPDTFAFDPSEWIFKPGWHDIAISPPLLLDPAIHKAEATGLDALLTAKQEANDDIDAAEDIFMIGRFVDYDGAETNVPSFRFGNISIMDAAIKQETGYSGRSIVVDMHSRTGYSGSPVFIYRTPGSLMSSQLDLMMSWHYLKIIGIHWGQFEDEFEMKAKGRSHLPPAAQASIITHGEYVAGLSGMTCVIPAENILGLLGHPDLVAMRESIEQQVEPEMERRCLRPKPMGGGAGPPDYGTPVQDDLEVRIQEAAIKMGIALG